MSETQGKTGTNLSPEQVQDVSGGFCEQDDLYKLLEGMTRNYEAVVDTVSHIIERVAGK